MSNKKVAITVFVFIVVSAVAFFVKDKFGVATQYTIEGPTSPVTVGQTFNVQVYLTESDASYDKSDVSAIDVRLMYDSSKMKIVSASPGSFFTNPITVKWDTNDAWFSLASNPANLASAGKKNNPDEPLIIVVFEALAPVPDAQIAINDESLIYVSKKGSVEPRTDSLRLSIE